LYLPKTVCPYDIQALVALEVFFQQADILDKMTVKGVSFGTV